MSLLTPAEKARTRREEEARLRSLEEASYRAEVREALAAEHAAAGQTAGEAGAHADPAVGGDDAPVPAEAPEVVHAGEQFVWGRDPHVQPAVAPARAAAEPLAEALADPGPAAGAAGRRRRGAQPWWWIAAGLTVAGIVLVVVALVGGKAAGGAKAVELALTPGGPIHEVAVRTWRPADLATDEYTVNPDGKIAQVPGHGLATFEDWRAAYEAAVPPMEDPFPEHLSLAELQVRYRENPPDMTQPRLRLPHTPERSAPGPVPGPALDPAPAPVPDPTPEPGGEAALPSDLLTFVPPESWLVVGLDKARLAASPALVKLHQTLAADLGRETPISTVGGAELLASASDLVFAGPLLGVSAEAEFVLAAHTSAAPQVRERALAASASRNPGPLPLFTLPSGEVVVAGTTQFAVARRGSAGALIKTAGGPGLLAGGPLSALVARLRPGAALFAALQVQPAQAEELERVVVGLGHVQAIGVALEVGSEVGAELGLSLDLVFADKMMATNVLANFEQRRQALAATPQGAMLGRIQTRIEGLTLRLGLRLTEAELLAELGRAGIHD